MKKIPSKMIKRLIITGSVICFSMYMNACATFKKPATINEAPVHERAITKESNGIRVSAAVVGDEEARKIFGIDLAQKKIQAVCQKTEGSPIKGFVKRKNSPPFKKIYFLIDS